MATPDVALETELAHAPAVALPPPVSPEARLELGSPKQLADNRVARSVLFRAYVRDAQGQLVRTASGKSFRRKSHYVGRVYDIDNVQQLKAYLA